MTLDENEPLLTQPPEEWRAVDRKRDLAAVAGAVSEVTQLTTRESCSAANQSQNEEGPSTRDSSFGSLPEPLPFQPRVSQRIEESKDSDDSNRTRCDTDTGMRFRNEAVPMFQTAGKKLPIHVSSESLLHANDLLSGLAVEKPCTHRDTPNKQLNAARRGDDSGDDLPVALKLTQFHENNSLDTTRSIVPLKCPVFQTAGKNKIIHVSADSISYANNLMSRTEVRPAHKHQEMPRLDDSPDMLCENDSTTATANSALNSMQRENTMEPMLGACPTFRTAGKNVKIHVSEESLSTANNLLSETDVENSTCKEPLHGRLNDASHKACHDSSNVPTGASLSSIQPDYDNVLNKFNPIKDSTGPCPVFQTAGKNLTIHVSAESLSNAHSLLSLENYDVQKSTDVPVTEYKFTHRNDAVTPPEAKTNTTRRTILNPYRNLKPNTYTPSKRSGHQVSQSSFNNINTNSAQVVTGFASNKLLYNPYTKTTSKVSTFSARNCITTNDNQTFVKNPYISAKSAPVNPSKTPFATKSTTEPAQSSTHSREMATSVSTDNIISSSTTVPRRVPSSRFFSMADRLPSRNVSYLPAEILTVGELYRYLYHNYDEHKNTTKQGQKLDSEDAAKPVYRKLTSVRITGVLLCTFYSDADRGKRELYSGGQLLLIGDPLEKTRFSNMQERNVKPNLDNERRTQDCSVTIETVSATPKTNVSMEKSTTSDKTTALTTPLLNGVSTNVNSNKVMSAGRSGGLTSDKKRKLVCTKNYGRNSLSSSTGIVRKFQTPKRTESTLSYPTYGTANRGSLFSSSKKFASRSLFGDNSATNCKNHGPSHIIRRHPSPIVPVWNGSTPDCNGLDGSVTGDLVMIMGDIVVECCGSCKNLANGCIEEEAAPTTDEVEVDVSVDSKPSDNVPILDVRDAARFIASCASNREGVNARKNCSQCIRFLRARFVKNANGTDMNLQKEALRVRREYIRRRREDMSLLLSGSSEHFAIGAGPYI
ncbi:hypothetical protein ACHAW6_015022 [Cyclotella cf. meneghiniana]